MKKLSAKNIYFLVSCTSPFALIALYLLLLFQSDSWWFATFLLFSPLYLFFLPLLLLIFAALILKRYLLLIPLGFSLIFLLFFIIGFNISLPSSPQSHHPFRVFTFNIDGGKNNQANLIRLFMDYRIDLAAFQECGEDYHLPVPKGFYKYQKGGLALVSRFPFESTDVLTVLQHGERWPATTLLHAAIKTPEGMVDFCTLHLPSPRFGIQELSDKFTVVRPSRSGWLEKLTRHRNYSVLKVKEYLSKLQNPLLIVGDFNTSVTGRLYRENFGRFNNAFSNNGIGFGFTQRAYYKGVYIPIRIDHILTGNSVVPLTAEVLPDAGSDHLPLVADVAINGK